MNESWGSLGLPGMAKPPGPRGWTPDKEARLEHLERTWRDLQRDSHLIGRALRVRDGRAVISAQGGLMEVEAREDVRAGDEIVLHRQSLQIIAVRREAHPTGIAVSVREVRGSLAEIDAIGVRRVVRVPDGVEVHAGDRVVVDDSYTYVLGSLGQAPRQVPTGIQERVSWDEIGGQEEAKEQLREAIGLRHRHAELFTRYGKRDVRGVLLYGPPGTGKTRLGLATATEIAEAHGKDAVAGGGFVLVKGPELNSKWVGESESNVRALFAGARDFKRREGYPQVIFFDEADAMFGSRDRGGQHVGSINQTVVPQFLAEMDGMDDHAALVILATNRPDMLDAAVTREGRIDRKIKVGRPSRDEAAGILEIHLRGRPLDMSGIKAKRSRGGDADPEKIKRETVARAAADAVWSSDAVVREFPDLGPSARVLMSHMASGAMLNDVVERAATTALRRDAASGRADPGGISIADLKGAIDASRRSQVNANVHVAVEELIEAGNWPTR